MAGKFSFDFYAYVANLVKIFNEAPTDAFKPELAKLDAMMLSLEIK